MTQRLLAAMLLATTALAVNADQSPSNAPGAVAAVDELARLSSLSKDELSVLLADCTANQQSMYFCAWRDQIAGELAAKQVLANKKQELPACGSTLDKKLASWMQSRDHVCAKSATKEWGEGSMRPTAQAICSAKETATITKRLARIRSCGTSRVESANRP